MSTLVLVDESKRGAYVIAVCRLAMADAPACRRALARLVLSGPRLHMAKERKDRQRLIASTIGRLPVTATIYVVDGHYAEREARARCLRALIADLSTNEKAQARLVLERDDSLVVADVRTILDTFREGGDTSRVEFVHRRAREEPLLALPDTVAWCWAKGGDSRRRLGPLIHSVRRP